MLALLGLGLLGVLTSRNLVMLLVALQVMAKAVIVALVWAGQVSGHAQLGQSLAVTVIVADAVVAVVGLALVAQVRRRTGSLDVNLLSRLRG
jgi:NADH:ubiquinone oxidoreductase subunit K